MIGIPVLFCIVFLFHIIMNYRTRLVSFALCLICLGIVFPAIGLSGTTGKISGKVIDAQTKEGLFGVNVLISGTLLGASTDVDGNYFIINIPPGTYQLKASAVGFQPLLMTDVKVFVDQTTKINLELQAQAVEIGAVEITATRPIVQRDLTSTTSTVTSDQLSTLPVEDVQSVVNLQAGVVDGISAEVEVTK